MSITDDNYDPVSLVGYLNFSAGTYEAAFFSGMNLLPVKWNTAHTFYEVRRVLNEAMQTARFKKPEAFTDIHQARECVRIALDIIYPSYLEFHQDLLAHLSEEMYASPFFIARLLSTTLKVKDHWDNYQNCCEHALAELNDYVGYRPTAVLENDRKAEPYPHEFLAPVPLYVQGVGAASGLYKEVIEATIELFEQTPEEYLSRGYVSLDSLHEICIDPRAYDCLNPAYKRTNYIFGEWDPNCIGLDGLYHRYVIRKLVIDSLIEWIDTGEKEIGKEEVLYDCAAILCGTILMASSVSGSGPGTHDSTSSLTNIMPQVASLRDEFYQHLLSEAKGKRAERLRESEAQSRQPFGHMRQALNLSLSSNTAKQAQYRQLAMTYAQMGYPDECAIQVAKIPAPAFRFESEIRCKIHAIQKAIKVSDLSSAILLSTQMSDRLHAGIECGAFVDPWNILGFQGLYPLFQNREDTIQDQRVEILLDLMHQIFLANYRIVCQAALEGYDEEDFARFIVEFERLVDWWDHHATNVVEGLPQVVGKHYLTSAVEINKIFQLWRVAGKPIGEVSFWSKQQDELTSSFSYAMVITALLDENDLQASIGLLMVWLSEAESISLETPVGTLNQLLIRWTKKVMSETLEQATPNDVLARMRKLFDFIEANAGRFWNVPVFSRIHTNKSNSEAEEYETPNADFEEPETEEIYSAAYEEMVFRDSAEDGIESSLADSGGSFYALTELERIQFQIEPHLRFLLTLAKLWQFSGHVMSHIIDPAQSSSSPTTKGSKNKQSKTKSADTSKLANPLPAEEAGETQPQKSSGKFTVEDRMTIEFWHKRIVDLRQQLEQLLKHIRAYQIDVPEDLNEDAYEFDVQHQVKYQLLNNITLILVQYQLAEWSIAAHLLTEEGEKSTEKSTRSDDIHQQNVMLIMWIRNQKLPEIRRFFPSFLKRLKKLPLLYTPYDQGGKINQAVEAQTRLALLKLLLTELPRLGLFREAWQLLGTCFLMERRTRVRGPSITEFDRLFKQALSASMRAILKCSSKWKRGKLTDSELVAILDEVLDFYRVLWEEHSKTMRLSPAEALLDNLTFKEIDSFVSEYGSDLYHPRNLGLPNLRGILHKGMDKFLEGMKQSAQSWDYPKILQDIDNQELDKETACHCLEIIYNIIIDRYERFMEYNSTTTLSDYGEKLTCFLEFMKVEVEYERDDWKLFPEKMMHTILIEENRTEIAESLLKVLAARTKEKADKHISALKKIEKEYGVKLPSVSDFIHERFLKPQGIRQMVAFIEPSLAENELSKEEQKSFDKLKSFVEDFQDTTQGSIIDLPEWLHELSVEVSQLENKDSQLDVAELLHAAPMIHVSLTEFRKHLRKWDDPIDPSFFRKNKKTKFEDDEEN